MQEHMRDAIKDQEAACKAGLLYIQTCANHTALEAKIKEKDEKFNKAVADFEESACYIFAVLTALSSTCADGPPSVSTKYTKSKRESKEKLDHSRDLLSQAEPEIQALFQTMEPVSLRFVFRKLILTTSAAVATGQDGGAGGRAGGYEGQARATHGYQPRRRGAVREAQA